MQVDLSLSDSGNIFIPGGCMSFFNKWQPGIRLSGNARRILLCRRSTSAQLTRSWLSLQGRNRTLAYSICESYFLPRQVVSSKEEDTEWAFGVMGLEDKARYLSTLYLKICPISCKRPWMSISGLVVSLEYLGRSASSFDELSAELAKPLTFTDHYLIRLLAADESVSSGDGGYHCPVPRESL